METKYYFYSWWRCNPRHLSEWEPGGCVTMKHPILAIMDQDGHAGLTYKLVSWQEITKEEYDLFMEHLI